MSSGPAKLPAARRLRKIHRVSKARITPQHIRLYPSATLTGTKSTRGTTGSLSVEGQSSVTPTATTLTTALIDAISSLTFSATPTQAECVALRDACVNALSAARTDLTNRETDVTTVATNVQASGSIQQIDTTDPAYSDYFITP